MPSPVAESPAREAAESMPEPAGPSKLSGAPISAPRDSPEPFATASASKLEQPPVDSASVQPALNTEQVSTVEVAPVTSEVDPVSLAAPASTVPLESTSGPIDEAAADHTHDVPLTHSPKAFSHTEFEHVEHVAEQAPAQEEALPVRRSEDSSSTQSHGQVIPPDERQLPTELLAAPWDNPPVSDSTSQPEQGVSAVPHAPLARLGTIEPTRVSTPPAPVDVPSANVDSVTSVATNPQQNDSLVFDQASADKSSVAGVTLKGRARGSTVSSQVHHPPAVSTEPHWEEVAAPPSNKCVNCCTNVNLVHDTVTLYIGPRTHSMTQLKARVLQLHLVWWRTPLFQCPSERSPTLI
jgi:hypothetical protein